MLGGLPFTASPLPAQPATGSPDSADLACVLRASRFAAAVHDLLHQESVERWPQGWALMERLGPSAVPALLTARREESNLLKRLVLIGALAAASRVSGDEQWLLQIATAKGSAVEDCSLAMLCLAVGDERAAAIAGIDQLAGEDRGSFLAVAAALASARCAPSQPAPARMEASGRASVSEQVAAAVRGTLPAEALRRAHGAVRQGGAVLGPALILRAALLGRAGKTSAELGDIARELVVHAGSPDELRLAAAIFLGRREERVADLAVADARALAALVAFPMARRELHQRGLLSATPEVLLEARTRRILAAGFALAAPWPAVAGQGERWARDDVVYEGVMLTAAWRALAREAPPAALGARLLALAPAGVPAVWWHVATATTVEAGQLAALDPTAARAVTLWRAGQAERGVLARQVECALWEAGAHPGLLPHAAWTALVRDALLAGSDLVHARLQRTDRPPLPRGIEGSHEKFFVVADRVFRFLTERVREPPPELRLR